MVNTLSKSWLIPLALLATAVATDAAAAYELAWYTVGNGGYTAQESAQTSTGNTYVLNRGGTSGQPAARAGDWTEATRFYHSAGFWVWNVVEPRTAQAEFREGEVGIGACRWRLMEMDNSGNVQLFLDPACISGQSVAGSGTTSPVGFAANSAWRIDMDANEVLDVQVEQWLDPECTPTLVSDPVPTEEDGIYTVDVQAPEGCFWSVQSDDECAEILPGANGVGDGTIAFRRPDGCSATLAAGGDELNVGAEAGDANADGEINVQDVVTVVNTILADGSDSLSDCNGDGGVNVQDVVCVVNKILAGN